MVLDTAPNVNLTNMLDKIINTYHTIKNSPIYHPSSATVHIPKNITNILTMTWFNELGLWFISSRKTLPNIHIDSQYIMDTLMDPYLGLELHALLLLLNDRHNHALKFDQSLEAVPNLPPLLNTALYNSWSQFNNHMNTLMEIRDIIYDHKR